MKAAPEVIVLAIGAAEEGAEIVKFGPAQGRRRAAVADALGIVGADAVDFYWVEFGQALVAQQGQGGDVVEGEAEIGEEHATLEIGGHVSQRLGQHFFCAIVDFRQQALFLYVVEQGCRFAHDTACYIGEFLPESARVFLLEIQRKNLEYRIAALLQRVVGNFRVSLPIAREAAGKQAQAADAETDIVLAEEGDCLGRSASLGVGERFEPAPVQLAPQHFRDG